MLKKIILSLTFLIILPAYSGEYENALMTGNSVFLYLYTQDCGYCKQFNSMYEKLADGSFKSHYKFLKIDANTEYGRNLMSIFRASYVPFVVLVDAKRQLMCGIEPTCLLNQACTEKELKKF